MNDLQKKEFELLKIFICICKKYNLKYYLVCGSALGAVKYGGFIPWDDDVDVALPRTDYEKFLSAAQKEVPENVFVQNCRTDKYYPGLGTKLRYSDTTFIEKEAMKIPMNHGIFIDVFPLDGYPQDEKQARAFEKKKLYYYRRRYTRLIPPVHRDLPLTFYSILFRFFGLFGETNEACKKNEELIKSNSETDSRLWCNFANSMSRKEYSDREIYGDGASFSFEGIDVVVPIKYKEYLAAKYGDYSLDPPAEEQKGSHGFIVDTEKPYTDYIKCR